MTIQEALREAYEVCTGCKLVNDCVETECRWHWIIKALEKQIPKKPKWGHHCPNCENGLEVPELLRAEYKELCIECCYPKYCPTCGQAIDWSDRE